tara:strand:+ start:86 stop:490 length:405 start_codon:yes stop_codon:yes gene_type:complete
MNLVKLAVGIKSAEDLKKKQLLKYKKYNENVHITRLFPKKFEIINNQSSMYWVINGHITVRQKILDLRKVQHNDGRNYCYIVLDKKLIETKNIRHRAFQGWRYLRPENSPNDIIVKKSGAKNHIYEILEDLYLI